MNQRNYFCGILILATTIAAAGTRAQEPATTDANGNARQHQGGRWSEGQEGPRPIFGKITSMTAGTMVLTGRDGQTVTVKLTEQTEFRKDREKAAAADFKVGDMVMVRGDETADHTVTAKLIGTRSGGPGGPGLPGGRMMSVGTLGKDYVAGEVRSIDAPKLTVLRPDNITQTVELNEETSLRRMRESITMADIQVGDHVMARGAMQNDVFVPKNILVMNAGQWKRMQEMGAPNGPAKPSGDATPAPAKPQE
jgi:hypothetical protein